jgi:predicted permease
MIALQYAWRSLMRSRGFVVVAVLALGFGLGLSTTMFAVLDTIANPVVAYRDPSTLTLVGWRASTTHGMALTAGELAGLIAEQARSVGEVTMVRFAHVRVEHQANVNSANGLVVEPGYFPLTGTRLQLGRAFSARDNDDVAIVSDMIWRQTYGDRRDLSGAVLTLDGRSRGVIGVVKRGRTAPEATDVWLPRTASDSGGLPWSFPLVRLPRGMTYLQSLGRFGAIGERLNRQYGSREAPIAVWSQPIAPALNVQRIRESHVAMLGATLCVLIVACVNLANLMLARGMARRRELALRMALGATRGAVVWQLFLECAVITAGGVLLGALIAVWGLDVLNHQVPGEVPILGLLHPELSWRTFAASGLAAALSAMAFGLVPAIRVVLDVNLDEPLKDGAGTTGHTRGRYSKLVVVEVALALVLMMGGGLLLRTIREITSVQYTFNAETLLEGWLRQQPSRDSASAVRRDALLDAVQSVPGVQAAAFERQRMPIGGVLTGEMVGGDSTRTINTQFFPEVSWRYIQVFGLAILDGRDFEPGDAQRDGAAILNPVAAQRLYPHGQPVGHMIKLGGPERNAPWVPIVGVARSPMALRSGEEPVGPMIWVVGADGALKNGGTIFVRAAREDPAIAANVRARLRSMPRLQADPLTPYTARRDAEVRSRAFFATAFVTMGTVALFLSAVGLYGMLTFAVTQRMREFAVRVALGAQRGQLFRMIMHDAAVILLAGTGLGAFAALATSRLLDSMLTNVLPSDVITLVACELVLMAAGFAAAFGPAQRALRANPLDILRAN